MIDPSSRLIVKHMGSICQEIYELMGTKNAISLKRSLPWKKRIFGLVSKRIAMLKKNRKTKRSSNIARVATYLPKILLLTDRAEDGIQAALIGLKACSLSGDALAKPTR